jgi:RNA polymerase sigma factor (sigma-70 family)
VVSTKELSAALNELAPIIESRYAQRLRSAVGSRVSEDDLCQVVAMRAVANLHAVRASHEGSLHAWLLKIAERAFCSIVSAERAQKRDARRERPADGTACSIADGRRSLTAADIEEVGSHVEALLAQLPALQSKALRLRYLEQLPYASVSEKLACSEQAARSLVARGLKSARALSARV